MNRKSLSQLFTDRRAVSPVLGVALLIAITVILAGVIGFVVLGVNAGNADGPSATLEFSQSGSALDSITVSVTHKGGDPVKAANLAVKVSNEDGATTTTSITDLSTGDSTDLTSNASPDEVIRIVWQDPNSDREVLLAEYTVE